MIARRRNIKTVLNKTSKLEGEMRVASFEVLAGVETVTLHREFGHTYRLDVCKVFFNSHLSYERRRVTLKVKPDEQVLIPFCGVGPFAIPAAARGAKVVAMEKNSEACKWLAENMRLNGVEEKPQKDYSQFIPNLNLRKTRQEGALVIGHIHRH